jgi:hypothetical protein
VILRTFGRVMAALLLLGCGAWATLALLVAGNDAGAARRALAAGVALLAVAAAGSMLIRRGGRIALPGLAIAFLAVLAWFFSLTASDSRTWTADVAAAQWAEIAGDSVTIHNVRNFAWRTEADFTPRWETRTVDLSRLDGVDLVASYWMGDAIAHVLVSFTFKDAPALAISIETRKEVDEPYSTLLGFFRRYELVYIAADERDLIGVRTNVRADPPEDVYLYHVGAPPAAVRRLFLEYLRQMNELREQPGFYNTATTNCTTMVLINNRVNGAISLLNWKILLSGYMPRLVYEYGRLDQTYPYPELRRRSRINNAARAAGIGSPDFSAEIRTGLPVPPR